MLILLLLLFHLLSYFDATISALHVAQALPFPHNLTTPTPSQPVLHICSINLCVWLKIDAEFFIEVSFVVMSPNLIVVFGIISDLLFTQFFTSKEFCFLFVVLKVKSSLSTSL